MSIGTILNRALDAVLPDVVGDAVGAFVDVVTGNPVGAVHNALDLCEDVFEAAGVDDHGWLGFVDDVADHALRRGAQG